MKKFNLKKINFKKIDFKKIDKKHITVIVSCVICAAILISFVALIAVPSMKRAALNSAKEELFKNYFSFPETGVVTSSNGFDDNTENSLIYVKSAMQNGADCIEIDVCFDKDGRPFVGKNADEIGEKTMPLEYLVSLLSEEQNAEITTRHSLNMHLTDASNIEEIDRIVKSYNMLDYCFFTGVNINQAKFIKESSEIKFYIDFDLKSSKKSNAEYASEVANDIAEAGGMGINCKADDFSNVLKDVFKENWLKISFYGANSNTEIIEALKYGPNQIISENPRDVKDILSEWNLNAPSNDILQYE